MPLELNFEEFSARETAIFSLAEIVLSMEVETCLNWSNAAFISPSATPLSEADRTFEISVKLVRAAFMFAEGTS